jgi:hypothetical protein
MWQNGYRNPNAQEMHRVRAGGGFPHFRPAPDLADALEICEMLP